MQIALIERGCLLYLVQMKSLQLTKPHMLVAVGLPGSGKTFFAERFSDTFNTPYVDYGYYSRVTDDANSGSELAEHTINLLVRTEQTIILEGRGSTKAERKSMVEAAAKKGYAMLFVWVQTEPGTAEQRAVYTKGATISQSQFDKQAAAFENLVSGEQFVVISGKHTFPSQAKTVLKRLVTERPTTVPKPKITATRPPASTPRVRGRINVG